MLFFFFFQVINIFILVYSSIPLSVGCPDPSMLSNIFQETVPDHLIDISFASATQQQQQPTFLTSSSVTSVFSAVSAAYTNQTVAFPEVVSSSDGYVDSELAQEISCLNTGGDLEIPLFTVPSLDDIR